MALEDDIRAALYGSGRIDLDPAQFAEAIVIEGSPGTLWRAVPCPCVRPETRLPRLDCPVCKGSGYAYPEHMREPTIFLSTSRSGSEKVSQAGMIVSGTVTLTVAPCKPLAQGDLFRPANEVHVVMERLWHGNAPSNTPQSIVASMRRNGEVPLSRMPGRAPRLLYPDVERSCIEAVTYIDPDTRQLVVARDADYRILDDSTFEWLGGKGPPVGAAWSVRYQAAATYMVQGSIPVYREQAQTEQPWRVVANRFDRVSLQDGHPE
jgi:hypothetical protein